MTNILAYNVIPKGKLSFAHGIQCCIHSTLLFIGFVLCKSFLSFESLSVCCRDILVVSTDTFLFEKITYTFQVAFA